MKRMYESPMALEERFTANEYIAACITGMIQCVYPGKPEAKGDNGVYDDFNGNESGWFYIANIGETTTKPHGMCGYDATISFNGSTGEGYEYNNGVIQKNRPITDIKGYEAVKGTYNVTWRSYDGDKNTGYYDHKGRLIINNIDDTHPNHS